MSSTKIHAPEGSLLAWPWGYDYVMAWIVQAAQAQSAFPDTDGNPDLDTGRRRLRLRRAHDADGAASIVVSVVCGARWCCAWRCRL